jgi:hypothetical protein
VNREQGDCPKSPYESSYGSPHQASLGQGGYDDPERPEPAVRVLLRSARVWKRELIRDGDLRDRATVTVD